MTDDGKFPDFSGKVVSFSSDESTLALLNPKFEFQAGKLFVVGTIPVDGTTNDWAEGRIGAISWESVTDYIQFHSQEDYSECLALSKEL